MSHKRFYIAMFKRLIKEWPGGSNIVMKITPIVTSERSLMTIGYKYNSWKVLGFFSTKGDQSNNPGKTYLFNLPENYSCFSIAACFSHKIRVYFTF